MTTSLNTSEIQQEISEKKLGRLLDLLKPVLRKRLKTQEQGQALIEAPSYVDRFDQLITELVGKLTNTYMVTVDYARSLEAMIKAGNYGYVNEDITPKNFPITGKGKVDLEVVLVSFNIKESALKELDELGLRAATLPELLAFGEMHSEVQRAFPIIALGSIANVGGNRHVPSLDGWGGERELRLSWFGSRWFGHCRFAAVRK